MCCPRYYTYLKGDCPIFSWTSFQDKELTREISSFADGQASFIKTELNNACTFNNLKTEISDVAMKLKNGHGK